MRAISYVMAAPNPWMILPFPLLLIAIALVPLFAQSWWLRHYAKVAFGLGAITFGYYIFVLGDTGRAFHTAHDYTSFIALVGSLFIVSGGIHINVKGQTTPFKNVLFLFVGAVVANVLGTTGAAILLIRPWIRMNQYRIAAHHIVFFIFIVADIGGCLTPIGNPPLFLGYLQGIPFWWVAKNCWPIWAVAVGILLVMFYILDRINFQDVLPAGREKEPASEAWKFDGLPNLFFLVVILSAIFVSRPIFMREAIMLAAVLGSYFTTKKSVHEANHFNFHPLREVAILFAGIFATMMPALDWLNANAHEVLGPNPAPGVFFWSAGGLSSVLDNAPTYLGFLSALFGVTGAKDISELLTHNSPRILAISIGAVFFGAATYIGNGPNFMVKAIADHKKIPMPTFLGFIFKYSFPFLLPMLIVVWWLFFIKN
jgi:Na+/H+ antiporter NhaD/arsenite permease-like protein